MNTKKINYAYLSGMLQAELNILATDATFLKMETVHERSAYVKRLIANAEEAAIEYETRNAAR